MTDVKSTHPEFRKYGNLVTTAFPSRVDYVINFIPTNQQATNKQFLSSVEKKAMEIIGQTTIDGVPLTNSHDWEINVSSFNPHGWSNPKFVIYLVGSAKSTSAGTVNNNNNQQGEDELKTMTNEEFKQFIDTCVKEVIQEMSDNPMLRGFETLRYYMTKFPSFIPDVITHKPSKVPSKFDVIARDTDQRQYASLIGSLDSESAAKSICDKIRPLYLKNLQSHVRGGTYKSNPVNNKRAKLVLSKLTHNSANNLKKESMPSIGSDDVSTLPEPKRRKAAQKELQSLRNPNDRYPSVIEFARKVSDILDKWGFDSEQIRRKYVSNDLEPDVMFNLQGLVKEMDNFKVGDRTGFTMTVYKDSSFKNYEIIYYLS